MILIFIPAIYQSDFSFIRDLPSPGYVYHVCIDGELAKYRAVLRKSEEMLVKFRQLSKEDQVHKIRQWFSSIEKRHEDLGQSKQIRKWDTNNTEISADFSKYDLAKLDLILMSSGFKPTFHQSEMLLRLYDMSLDSHHQLVFNRNVKQIPFGANDSGPRTEPFSASFELYCKPATTEVIKWLKSDKPLRPFTEMTYFRFARRLAEVEKLKK